MRTIRLVSLTGLGLALAALPLAAQEGVIQDNSFLIEEAYNQEPGVVQHISVLELPRDGGDWSFSFTQEWPAGSLEHQLSYTLPAARVGDHRGLGDVALNSRYPLVGDAAARLAVAPRVSLLLPTGASDEGLGAGGVGFELALPVSVALSEGLAGHWNVGVNHVAGAANEQGAEADLDGFFVGQGLVWLVRPTLNFLLEARWDRAESVAGPRKTTREESLVVSPGVRWAQNLPGDLQIVYGLALPAEVGAGDGARSVLLYLSFEHPFGRVR